MIPRSTTGLSIVIPAYNEQHSIAETASRLAQVIPELKRDCEVILVDDGSTDGTAAAATASGLAVLRHPSNFGYGRSLLTGIESARYDTIAILDADGTYPIESLADLLAFYDRGFHMAVGARTGRYYHGSTTKWILRQIFRFLAEFTCGRRIPDVNSGFRIFDRRPVLAWRGSLSTGFSFTTTITLLFMLNHFFVGYLPIRYEKRTGSSKVRLVRDTLRSLQIIVTAIAQFNPLKLYLLIAAIVGVVDLLILFVGWINGPLALAPAIAVLIAWNGIAFLMGMSVIALTLTRSPSLPNDDATIVPQIPGQAR
jgi:glycosyltransferase involved in cell wall biosynthesis